MTDMTERRVTTPSVPPDPSLPGPARLLIPDRTPRTIAVAVLCAAAIGLPIALLAPDGPAAGIATAALLGVVWMLIALFGTIQGLMAGPGWIAEKRALRWHIVRATDLRRARITLPPSASAVAWLKLYSASGHVDLSARQLALPGVAAVVKELLREARARGPVEGLHADGLDHLAVEGSSGKQRRYQRVFAWVFGGALALEAVVGLLRLLHH